MVHAMDSYYAISVDYNGGNKFETVKRQLHIKCTEIKDGNWDGTGQLFLAGGPHDQGLPDSLKSIPPTLAGDGVCEKSNTISTSIGRKLLRTFPRSFSKIQWINLKKELQFRFFFGYQGQLFPYLGGVTKPEYVGISAFALLGFQIAAAPNMPTIVNRVSIEPYASSGATPPLQATSAVPDPSAKETEDTNSPEIVELSLPPPQLRSETIDESQFSPALEAWFHDLNMDPSGIPPGPFRSQQIARKKKVINEMLGKIDQILLSSLENLNLNESPDECPKFETLGTEFHQTSPGSRNQSGSRGKNFSNPGNPPVTPNSNKGSGQGKKKRTRDNSNDEDEGGPEKPPRKRSDLGEERKILCTYYANETNPEAKEGHRCKKLLFANHADLCEHIQGVHLKPVQCPRCLTRYGKKREFNRHTRGGACHLPEAVQDYVLEFNKKVLSSTEDTIYDILYVNGRKRYDYLDCTNELRSGRDAAPEEGGWEEINGELVKNLNPRDAGNLFETDSRVTSQRDPKISVPESRVKFLAQLDQEYKLAEKSGEAAIEQFMQQFTARLPPSARLALGYVLKEQKAMPSDKSAVDGTSSWPQPPVAMGNLPSDQQITAESNESHNQGTRIAGSGDLSGISQQSGAYRSASHGPGDSGKGSSRPLSLPETSRVFTSHDHSRRVTCSSSTKIMSRSDVDSGVMDISSQQEDRPTDFVQTFEVPSKGFDFDSDGDGPGWLDTVLEDMF